MGGESGIAIAQLFPDVLGTYGDNGNAIVLRERLRWRGIAAEIVPIRLADPVPSSCAIYLLGGGEDALQKLAAEHLLASRGLTRAVARQAPVLAVCAGMQILGESFAAAGMPPSAGLGLLDLATTARRGRAIGEAVIEPDDQLLPRPIVGFENHLGGTTIGPSARPLGRVLRGVGNGAGAHDEGIVQGRIIGTYLHGPVLARNPELADLLLGWATGIPMAPLQGIDDELRRLFTRRTRSRPSRLWRRIRRRV